MDGHPVNVTPVGLVYNTTSACNKSEGPLPVFSASEVLAAALLNGLCAEVFTQALGFVANAMYALSFQMQSTGRHWIDLCFKMIGIPSTIRYLT